MFAPHLTSVRVYYEDTDFSGVVYHASYLRFLERGRTEFLRAHAITQSRLHHEEAGLVFVVSRLSIDYVRAAGMDDLLTIETVLADLRGASMVLKQAATCEERLVVRADVTVAAVRDGRPVRIPSVLREALTAGGATRKS